MARILVAHTSDPTKLLAEALSGHDIDYVATMSEACRAVDQDGYSLIFCTLQFDDSRMFDLLRFCKSQPKYRAVPFICVRVRDSHFASPIILESLELASRALGAEAFVDLVMSDGAPADVVRQIVERYLSDASNNFLGGARRILR